MKFRTFRALALGVVVAAAAGGVYWITRKPPRPRPVPVAEAPPPPPPVAPAPTPAPAPAPVADPAPAPGNLRPMDQEILALVRAGISGDKKTDAIRGKPYKVNLYQDKAGAGVNRLKVDLDRDGKWDEKWSLGPDGTWKRQVAPADDESYTETYLLDGSGWKRKESP